MEPKMFVSWSVDKVQTIRYKKKRTQKELDGTTQNKNISRSHMATTDSVWGVGTSVKNK